MPLRHDRDRPGWLTKLDRRRAIHFVILESVERFIATAAHSLHEYCLTELGDYVIESNEAKLGK